jgi:hypothetical protein
MNVSKTEIAKQIINFLLLLADEEAEILISFTLSQD